MPLNLVVVLLGLAALIGVAFGYFLRWIISLGQRGSLELKIKQIELQARETAKKITEEAEKRSEEIIKESRSEIREKEDKIKKTEDRLIKKEEFLDKRQLDIDKEIEQIKEKVVEIKNIKEKAEELEKHRYDDLQKISSLSEEEAKEIILKEVERKFEQDFNVRIQKLENQGMEKMEGRSREILTTAIHRLANSVSSDIFTSTISIPSEEVKGKIIGKEGRNIKSFERVSGVEIIVDDTPGSITLSSYDPVRRQIAKIALENLIQDGRIQPAKIEEMVEKAKQEVNKIIKDKGEAAAFECGVFNLDPRIICILGRLYFRTSYGQNVLQHSIEMSHIAGMLAQEIGANINVAKAGALLHDIGKAVDHEITGTHVEIGRRILQKFGADEKIIKAMEAHHGEHPYETLESYIVQAADAISGARPGARRDSVENYIKRLQELESIANSFHGVEKSYAIQAGREVRVFVTPSEITELEAKNIARDIAIRIENELKYPGEIKIMVIRESRTIEYAR